MELMWIHMLIDEESRKKIVSLCRQYNEDLGMSGHFIDHFLHISLKRSFYTDRFEEIQMDLSKMLSEASCFVVHDGCLKKVKDRLWICFEEYEELKKLHEKTDAYLKERYDIEIDTFDSNYLPHISLFKEAEEEKTGQMLKRLQKDLEGIDVKIDRFCIGGKAHGNEIYHLKEE